MKWLIVLIVVGATLSGQGRAAFDEEEIAQLREQVRLLSERLDRLEASGRPENGKDASTGVDVEQEIERRVNTRLAESWTDRIRWKGDFRYRYENIDVEGIDERNRQRIRARAQLEAKIGDDTRVGFGLASGGLDPVSTNQTLGAGGSSKDINLNLAYFQWTGVPNTEIVGGKFKNLLYRPGGNGLLWDSDWNPEGLAFHWNNGPLFASGIGTWVESDSDKFNQEFSYGGQAGWRVSPAESVDLVVGAGYYRFDTAGSGSFFGDADDFFGNSFDPEALVYLYDFHEVEAFLELHFDFFGRPMSVFGDYVTNLEADENDTGYAFGVKNGDAKAPGSWDFSVIYQDLQADAVLGLLTDSDFGGGGTNARGYILNARYAFRENWNAQFTYFINEIGINTGDPRDFDRLQLDLNLNYE